jgi:hypothetical protein
MIVADSDVLIDALRGREPARSRIALEISSGGLATTAISAFELLAGAQALASDPAADRRGEPGRSDRPPRPRGPRETDRPGGLPDRRHLPGEKRPAAHPQSRALRAGAGSEARDADPLKFLLYRSARIARAISWRRISMGAPSAAKSVREAVMLSGTSRSFSVRRRSGSLNDSPFARSRRRRMQRYS